MEVKARIPQPDSLGERVATKSLDVITKRLPDIVTQIRKAATNGQSNTVVKCKTQSEVQCVCQIFMLQGYNTQTGESVLLVTIDWSTQTQAIIAQKVRETKS